MATGRVSDTPAAPLFVISVAAELAGMHPQTLRQYDRLGLVTPSRTQGRGRRYSADDVQALREIQRLSQEEGINLAGIREILRLRRELREAERAAQHARREAELIAEETDARRSHRIFAAGPAGDVVLVRHGTRLRERGAQPAVAAGELTAYPARSSALVLWRR